MCLLLGIQVMKEVFSEAMKLKLEKAVKVELIPTIGQLNTIPTFYCVLTTKSEYIVHCTMV